MRSVVDKINKILSYKTWSDKKKIDQLLEMDCIMYTNLGIDSTKHEKEKVKRNSKAIYRAIKNLNQTVGNSLLSAIDKEV